MKINNINTVITGYEDSELRNYGFTYEFSSGLNILTGDNSSGKSTIFSCIYYCLGLEQLIGSKGVKALPPVLHQQIKAGNKYIQVLSSFCTMNITAKNGKSYTLKRSIKSDGITQFNEIEIDSISEGMTFSKYIHSVRDHEEHGFYRWISEINSLKIFEVESIEGANSKPLYMQNIFTLSFIEQTKGWADFFSMMPNFGIKDVKQKVVEYSLGLKNLETSMELDQLRKAKDEIKTTWKQRVRELEFNAKNINAYISDFDHSKPINKEKLNKIYAVFIDLDGNETSLDKALKDLYSLESESTKSTKTLSSTIPKDLTDEKDLIVESLTKLQKEYDEVYEIYEEELDKLKQYDAALYNIQSDLQDFQDIQKISINRNWDKLSSATCPVCEHSIVSKRNANIPDEKINRTTDFLKSQKKTYSIYKEASSGVIDRCRITIDYYKNKINSRRVQLDSISKDINEPTILGIRAELRKQAELEQQINKINNFLILFEGMKEKLKSLSIEFSRLEAEESLLVTENSDDNSTIDNFQQTFISNLKSFGYKSNGTDNIKILDKPPYRLLPTVELHKQGKQNIRYVSSASDFVRAIWAYYLALLANSERHPGFILMDEPGQHQMRLNSVKELLKVSISTGKQVILAISQDRKYEDEAVNIHELVQGLDKNSFNLNHIEDGAGCVVKLTNSLN